MMPVLLTWPILLYKQCFLMYNYVVHCCPQKKLAKSMKGWWNMWAHCCQQWAQGYYHCWQQRVIEDAGKGSLPRRTTANKQLSHLTTGSRCGKNFFVEFEFTKLSFKFFVEFHFGVAKFTLEFVIEICRFGILSSGVPHTNAIHAANFPVIVD